jgi:glycosyltransferase involved in cell wall biosynthesis
MTPQDAPAGPLISLITVTWNCAASLPRTLASVAAVKALLGESVEYVVVDGASTDGTLALIGACADIDRYVSEPDNGIYNAMNKALALARGKYLLFINGDDELVPHGYPAAAAALRQARPPVLCCVTVVDTLDSPAEVLAAAPRRLPFFNTVPHPSTFVCSDLMRRYRFREDLRIAADYDLFLRLYLEGHAFAVSGAVTALHHRGGVSGNAALSTAEVERVKSERLGWRYPLIRLVQATYRLIKRVGGRP